MDSQVEAILNFWFGELGSDTYFPEDKAELWFKGGEAFDQQIQKQFGVDVKNAMYGAYDDWKGEPDSCLALILLLDQFMRNCFRGEAAAFAADGYALELAQHALDKGFDQQLHRVQRVFVYLPFEHSEKQAMQQKSVALFQALADQAPPELDFMMQNYLDYAQQHAKIIERFGRFPHRNEIVGRSSTPEEIEFLQQPNSGF